MVINKTQLINKLRGLYHKAPQGESTVSLIIFGIKYAESLKELKVPMGILCADAGVRSNAAMEINQGITLSKYVEIKDEH